MTNRWRRYVREHLPPLDVPAERETEIVDELAMQLEATFERAQAEGDTDDGAMKRAVAEVPDWHAFARTVGGIERAGRTQEIAVRRSLGAARWRLARQMLTESVLLAVVGGALGVAVASAGFEALVALLPPNQPRVHIVTIDWRVITVAAIASIATGILFGLMPALQAATGRSLTLLRSARVTGASHAAAGTRRTLMLAEVALVLLTGAGLMLRTMSNLAAVDTGFMHEQIVSAQLNLPRRFDAPKRVAFYEQVVERLRALPGVVNAAYTFSIPKSLLFGVAARDSLTLSVAAMVLLMVTAIACVIPARRATRVDPATALRLD